MWLVPSQKNCETSCSGVSHTGTCHVALRKVEAASTFSATCNTIFCCETSCKHGVSHEEENCLVRHGLKLELVILNLSYK